MADIVISRELIELGLEADTKQEVIRQLGGRLRALGYVTDGYCENVIKREEEFPTGLPTIIPVALCHTEAQYVKRSALAVGTLARPVEFKEMGAPDRNVKAEIVFLLALNDPKDQVPWLKKMVTVFKSKEALDQIKEAEDKEELEAFLKSVFL